MKDDILYLIHLLNTKASVTVKTPMGDTSLVIIKLSETRYYVGTCPQ